MDSIYQTLTTDVFTPLIIMIALIICALIVLGVVLIVIGILTFEKGKKLNDKKKRTIGKITYIIGLVIITIILGYYFSSAISYYMF